MIANAMRVVTVKATSWVLKCSANRGFLALQTVLCTPNFARAQLPERRVQQGNEMHVTTNCENAHLNEY